MEIVYRGPTGDEVKDVDCDYIRNLVYNTDEEYWKYGSGDSCIEIEGSAERLIFFCEEPFGFFIMRHPDYLAPYNIKISNLLFVSHNIGGEKFEVKNCYFVTREMAAEILCEYVNTGTFPNQANWRDIYENEQDE